MAPKDELAAQVDLRRLGRETIFSKEVHDGDPHTGHYTIAVGDTLGKIADAHLVTPELLARINGLSNINMIQAGHRLKVVQGPFHVRVIKSAHALDVFLGESLVEHFKVGLGAEGATPTGEWVVSSKLKNPTYYSPRGDGIIQANDPKNPLGERWIGLQGVGGNALGQMRYGIHGTIEPESIGKNASLGCIRMYNEDAEFLYDLLVVGHSKVFVVD